MGAASIAEYMGNRVSWGRNMDPDLQEALDFHRAVIAEGSRALVGYEAAKKKIEDTIKEIRAQIGGKKVTAKRASSLSDGETKRRKLSVAARKRIAVAQRKRWREHRKAAAQAAKG